MAFKDTGGARRYKPRQKHGLVGTAGKGVGKLAPQAKTLSTAKPVVGKAPAVAAPKRPAVGERFAPDAAYNQQVDIAERKGEQRLAELGNQENDIKREFGIEDPTEPFSRANTLKQSFLARQKAASASLASQGQLYSGSHERALSRTRREEEQARSELRRVYEGAIGQVGAEKAGVKFNTEEERTNAFEAWLARAPEADVALDEEAPAAAAGAPKAPPSAADTGQGYKVAAAEATVTACQAYVIRSHPASALARLSSRRCSPLRRSVATTRA